MQHTIRRARPARVVATTGGLALAISLLAPGAAFATTTEPTVTTTTAPAPTQTTDPTTGPITGSSTASATTGSSSSPTGTDSSSATGSPTPSSPTSPSGTGSTATGTDAAATTAAPSAASKAAGLVKGGRSSRYGLAAPAGPATSTDPTLVAAHYLAAELAASDGAFFTIFDGVKYFDWGLTADAVLGLDAAGAGQDQAAESTALLATNVRSYATGADWGAPNDVSAGSTAKLLNVAVAQNVDPTAFGGFDLVATLQGLLGPDGLFVDRGAANYTNTIGQSLAIIGLERTNAGAATVAPSAAVAGLRSLQCTDGGFRLYYPTGQDTGCSSDPDATAYAVQALVTVAGASDADAQAALDYLAGRQGAGGGVGGSGPTAAANANSTGLAGQAFLAGGRTANARLAASFIRALQYGCSFPAALRGGIAYDRAAYDTQVDAGRDATPADQDRRSTAQAILALAGTPLGVVSAAGADATAPALACAAVPSTTTSTTSTTTTTSGSAPAPTGSGDPADPAAPAGSATPGDLAFTGSTIAPVLLLALALLLVGAGALVIARRKGAHA